MRLYLPGQYSVGATHPHRQSDDSRSTALKKAIALNGINMVTTTQPNQVPKPAEPKGPSYHVAPSPHIFNTAISTRWMMYDVVIGLLPVIVMSIVFFHHYAVIQLLICTISCMASEAVFAKMRGRAASLTDGSAAVTGMILGLSLPWQAPIYVSVLSSVVAIGLGKAVFGGLGLNIFNPAMVGRAFVMLSFPSDTGAAAYINPNSVTQIMTQATPLSAAKSQAEAIPDLWPLLIGSHNGSLGETSVLACLIGGAYLCYRRSASWEIPVSMLLSVSMVSYILEIAGLSPLTVLQQLASGSMFFGAFFIATDPVSSPLTEKGKWIYGIGIGIFTVIIRTFSGYPEGVMFAVLLMNAAVPLINQWTTPRPLGGVLSHA